MKLRPKAGGIARRICVCLAMMVMAVYLSACHAPPSATLTLSVAASLEDAIVEVEADYNRSHAAIDFRNNFGSSGTLAREIEEGAPVDVFFAAASKPVDDLDAKGLVAPGTRHDLLRNQLVLIAPQDSKLRDFKGLADRSIRFIALGDPGSVPAGQYGRQTLRALDLFDKIGAKLVLGKDVRQVLTYVETGNADAGLVYSTDAETSGKVRVVAVAPESTHDPIVYPAVVLKSSRDPEDARKFIEFLGSPAAQAIFIKRGFTIASS
jgi:molybdate transport system substrate-binding protein